MEWYYILAVCLGAAAVLILLALLFALPVFVYRAVFGVRQDRNPNLKYFSPEEFSLSSQEFKIFYRGTYLYGALYYKRPLEECEKLIIFSHGMGAGHCAYTTEIAYFAEHGYVVLAYDNFGCDRSEGKGTIGFYAGAEAVIAAYIAVKSDSRLKDKPIFLVGHSWGGYSVLCAAEKVNVQGVVAVSAFASPVRIFCDIVKLQASGIIAALIRPGIWLIQALKFGAKGNRSSVSAVEESKTPALLVWGEQDGIVKSNQSAACLAKGENITRLIEKDKRHNPYNTVAAEDKLASLSADKSALSEAEKQAFFDGFDFKAATEEDEKVMSAVLDFISRGA